MFWIPLPHFWQWWKRSRAKALLNLNLLLLVCPCKNPRAVPIISVHSALSRDGPHCQLCAEVRHCYQVYARMCLPCRGGSFWILRYWCHYLSAVLAYLEVAAPDSICSFSLPVGIGHPLPYINFTRALNYCTMANLRGNASPCRFPPISPPILLLALCIV